MYARRWLPRDAAVDTVIGFILITAIALGSSALVLLWGGPALERVQVQQESDSMLRFMTDLDSEISGLIGGAPAATTPVWRVAFSRGSMELEETGHIWAFAVDLEDTTVPLTDHRLNFAGFGNGGATFDIQNDLADGALFTTFACLAFRHDGAEPTSISCADTVPEPFLPGDEATITLGQALAGESIEVRFFDGPTTGSPVGRVWFIDSGAVVWTLPGGGQVERIAYENTAVLSAQPAGIFLANQPQVRGPVEKSATVENVFLRVVKLDGSIALGGRSSAEVLLSSGGSHSRYASASVERAAIYPPSAFQEAWERLLDDDNLGYTYALVPHEFGALPSVAAVREPVGAGQLSAILVETDVTLEVISRS